ncbi:MAG: 1,6-anhydro-N-acetylmuramyl-L-alanine amidase AmpD [Nevskia sp.]|nr:1,6-anhydro-N-acetylmuramyl-L-alanine amidase AmpD [Nevskia sp.]
MNAQTGASDLAAGGRVPRFAIDTAHWLHPATLLPSPHYDERPDAEDVSLLVVHAISLPPDCFGTPENRGYIDDLFLGRLDPAAHPYFAGIQGRRVSAHACIFRDGGITQYVPFDRRAWHAGESWFEGRSRCNDFSIGVELEGCDTQPFTDAQYATLIALTLALLRHYPRITAARITGHSDIAPGRKTDPGPHFDWPRLRAAVAPA